MLTRIISPTNGGKTLFLVYKVARYLNDTDKNIHVFLPEHNPTNFMFRLETFLERTQRGMNRTVAIYTPSKMVNIKDKLDKMTSDDVVMIDDLGSLESLGDMGKSISMTSFMAFLTGAPFECYACIQTHSDSWNFNNIEEYVDRMRDTHTPDGSKYIFLASNIGSQVIKFCGMNVDSNGELTMTEFFNPKYSYRFEGFLSDERVDNPEPNVKVAHFDQEEILQGELPENLFVNFGSISKKGEHELYTKFNGRRVRITVETID